MSPDKPSRTALLIAAAQLVCARQPAYQGWVSAATADYCQAFLRTASRRGRRFAWLLQRRWGRGWACALERWLLPGLFAHFLLRKRYLREQTEAAVAAGLRQVVVFGAGFDTLALTMAPHYPHVQFIEIDHPATQAVKSRVLADQLPVNLRLLPVDFTQTTAAAALQGCADFRAELPVCYIAEGLLMYLTAAEVSGLLAQVAAGSGNRLLFTFMELQEQGQPAFRRTGGWLAWWLRHVREPFRWGIAPPQLAAFLAAQGLELQASVDSLALQRRYDPRLPIVPALGEWVAWAQTAEPLNR